MIEHLFLDDKGIPPSKGIAFARVIVVSMFLCILMGIAINEFVKASQMEGYQHTSAIIVSSDLTVDEESPHREAPYGVILRARFAYGGRTWIGKTSTFGTLTSDAAEA